MSRYHKLQLMIDTGVVGVIRTESSEKLLRVAEAIREGGSKVHCNMSCLMDPQKMLRKK